MFEGSDVAYDGMYLVGFIIMMLMNIIRHKKFNLATASTVYMTLLTYVYGIVGAMIMGLIYTAYAGSENSSTVCIFGAVVFTPILLLITLKVLNKDAKKYLDMLAPGIFVILGCAKYGCFMGGCCAGIEYDGFISIYNPVIELQVFPEQIFEATAIILLVVGVLIYSKKRTIKNGAVYPIMSGVYSLMRFGFEFIRRYPTPEIRNFFMGLTIWQCFSVLVFVASLVSVFCLYREGKDLTDEE